MAHDSLTLHYSGGSTNTDPNLSLGGIMSTSDDGHYSSLDWSYTGGEISGIKILTAWGVPLGDGTLTFTYPDLLAWVPYGGGTAEIQISEDGEYALGVTGKLIVKVTAASLPGSTTYRTVTISKKKRNLFDDVSYEERVAGDVEYRCLWIKNNGPGTYDLALSITVDPTYTDLAIGSEFVSAASKVLSISDSVAYGVWDFGFLAEGYSQLDTPSGTLFGVLNGYFVAGGNGSAAAGQDSDGATGDLPFTISNENDPNGDTGVIVWGTTLDLPTIGVGKCFSFWIRRTVPSMAGTPLYEEEGTFSLSYAAAS